MTIKIELFKEVFDILKEIFSGLNSVIQIPENNRREMRGAVADTAELIDETLTILKQHLTSVVSELKFGDKQKAKQMIYELNNFQGWETKYREFQLCEKLREAVFNLDRKGLYERINNLSISNIEVIKQRMSDYIGGEANIAILVGRMLEDLSVLESKVDGDFDVVVKQLEEARNQVATLRQSFIDLENEIRI